MLTIQDISIKGNGVPRVLDTRLAEVLGFSSPLMIRKIIKRNLSALSQFGEVFSTVEKTTRKGGRPGERYYLTEKQALYLCTKSEASKAVEITIQMVELFYQLRLPRVKQNAALELPRHGKEELRAAMLQALDLKSMLEEAEHDAQDMRHILHGAASLCDQVKMLADIGLPPEARHVRRRVKHY